MIGTLHKLEPRSWNPAAADINQSHQIAKKIHSVVNSTDHSCVTVQAGVKCHGCSKTCKIIEFHSFEHMNVSYFMGQILVV